MRRWRRRARQLPDCTQHHTLPRPVAPCVSSRCVSWADYDPVPGQWYENAEEEETFQVLSVDEDWSSSRFNTSMAT